MRWALFAPAIGLALGCKKPAPPAAPDADVPQAVVDGGADAGDAPPRCVLTERASLGGASAKDSFDFGEGVSASGDGAVLGVVRASEGVRRAAVARVGPHVPARVIDLGTVTGDDPPPQPFTRGNEIFAAGYVEEPAPDGGSRRATGPRGRRLSIFRVTDAPERLVTLTQTSDESPAFDVVALPQGAPAGALLVWDEDATPSDAGADSLRGVIRAALLGPDLRSVAQTGTVSPDVADAERPRVVLRDGGFWVAWIARKREAPRDAGPELEAPAEDRAFRWVELLALDEHARPQGAVRRLSSSSGHVAGFDLVAAGSRVDVAIVTDDELADAAGGEVLHVVASAEGTPRSASTRGSGAGRGTAPWLGWVAGAPGWLTYVDTSDRTRLVPLDPDGAGTGSDSVEPLLDDARPVLASGPFGILAVSPGAAGSLRWLSCPHR